MTVLSVMIRQVWQGQDIANVLWFDQENVGTAAIQNTVDQIAAVFDELLQPILSTQWEGNDMLVRVFDGDAPFSTVYAPAGWPIVGVINAADLPRNVALLIATSSDGARPNRGRIFLGGLTEAGWSDGTWEATYLAAAEAAAEALTDLEDTDWVIARPNYTLNTAISNPVTSWLARGFPGSQRGRR